MASRAGLGSNPDQPVRHWLRLARDLHHRRHDPAVLHHVARVAQSFLKVAALDSPALTGSEPPLAVAPSGILPLFILLAVLRCQKIPHRQWHKLRGLR